MSRWLSIFPGYTYSIELLKMTILSILKTGPLPRHVGLIMDGNRRYAKTHNMETTEGHTLGLANMESILSFLYKSGVVGVSVYLFSIENFKRPQNEVDWILNSSISTLFKMVSENGLCEKYEVRIQIVGKVTLWPEIVQNTLQNIERKTVHYTRAVLYVCFPYTSRDEIAHSVREIISDSLVDSDIFITEDMLEKHLYTSGSPPLDLLIRTSDATRLSDFLLWQCVPSSCSITFIDRLWPEFSHWDLMKILFLWSYNKHWCGDSDRKIKQKSVVDDSLHHSPAQTNHDSFKAFERYNVGEVAEKRSKFRGQNHEINETKWII